VKLIDSVKGDGGAGASTIEEGSTEKEKTRSSLEEKTVRLAQKGRSEFSAFTVKKGKEEGAV